jgi:hypothetical protein
LYCIVLYCIVLYCIVLYCIVYLFFKITPLLPFLYPCMTCVTSFLFFFSFPYDVPKLPLFASTAGLLRLHLEFNQLTIVPESLFRACQNSLFELHLHDNQLSELPATVALLTELKVLDVSNNNLNDLPPTLGYIATLQRLLVDGNPIRTIRRTLLTQSTVNLKKYLCTRGPPLESPDTELSGKITRNMDEYNEYGWAKEDGSGSGMPLEVLQRLRQIE